MREIKFRAWGPNCKTMWNWEQTQTLIRELGWEGEKILMQYTGLKDKNGKEIYEGDVVRCDKREWYRTKLCLGRVDLDELPDYQEEVGWDYELLDMRKTDYPKYWEVIGNIYENGDLLD